MSLEHHLNVTGMYFTPHEYYMILPALGISAVSVTTIYRCIANVSKGWFII